MIHIVTPPVPSVQQVEHAGSGSYAVGSSYIVRAARGVLLKTTLSVDYGDRTNQFSCKYQVSSDAGANWYDLSESGESPAVANTNRDYVSSDVLVSYGSGIFTVEQYIEAVVIGVNIDIRLVVSDYTDREYIFDVFDLNVDAHDNLAIFTAPDFNGDVLEGNDQIPVNTVSSGGFVIEAEYANKNYIYLDSDLDSFNNYVIEYSDDNKATWYAHPGYTIVTAGGEQFLRISATYLNQNIDYRLRSTATQKVTATVQLNIVELEYDDFGVFLLDVIGSPIVNTKDWSQNLEYFTETVDIPIGK